MLAKDEELVKVKEKHLYAEQQLQEMEEKQHQVNFKKAQLSSFSVPRQEIGLKCRINTPSISYSLMGDAVFAYP